MQVRMLPESNEWQKRSTSSLFPLSLSEKGSRCDNCPMPVVSFQRLTLVRLIWNPNPPPDSPGDGEIQAAHIRYLSALVEAGTILVNGPVKRIDDTNLLGMSLYTVGPEAARRIAEADPGTRAGWFQIMVDEWVFPARPKTIGDKVDFEMEVPT